jgi:hypothetical protein
LAKQGQEKKGLLAVGHLAMTAVLAETGFRLKASQGPFNIMRITIPLNKFLYNQFLIKAINAVFHHAYEFANKSCFINFLSGMMIILSCLCFRN